MATSAIKQPAPAPSAGARCFAGRILDRPLVMGIVNVTPDSFSDGGRLADADAAIDHALRLIDQGADIVDIGGESTRPGAQPVATDIELARVMPVVERLAPRGALVSIDTRKAAVMRAALAAGATIVNDITALTYDSESLGVAAAARASVILMHMQGDPATMQRAPHYRDVVAEVQAYLAARVAACRAAGIPHDRLAVDPGIGFGKSVEHNLALLGGLKRFAGIGPLVVGVSRKGFIGAVAREATDPASRLPGSIAAALAAVVRGADILRVHDVAATVQALAVWRAIGSH